MEPTDAGAAPEDQDRLQGLTLEHGTISAAYRDLEALPVELGQRYGTLTRRLDLSHNMLNSLEGIAPFTGLQELILDGNCLDDQFEFPLEMPALETLSLNKNQLANLDHLLEQVRTKAPNLRFLSLLGNQLCPNELVQKDEDDYQRYRYFVLHHLPNLKFLDSRPVTADEVKEASRIGGYMKIVRIEEPEGHDAGADSAGADQASSSFNPLPHQERDPHAHRGTLSKSKYVYYGRHSEGNRFIRNSDL